MLQQVPIKEGLIQSALKLIRDFLSLCCWGLDQISASEMVTVSHTDVLMQSLPVEDTGIFLCHHQLYPPVSKGNCNSSFFTTKILGSEVNSAKTHTNFLICLYLFLANAHFPEVIS